jgi:hypothetical protein
MRRRILWLCKEKEIVAPTTADLTGWLKTGMVPALDNMEVDSEQDLTAFGAHAPVEQAFSRVWVIFSINDGEVENEKLLTRWRLHENGGFTETQHNFKRYSTAVAISGAREIQLGLNVAAATFKATIIVYVEEAT